MSHQHQHQRNAVRGDSTSWAAVVSLVCLLGIGTGGAKQEAAPPATQSATPAPPAEQSVPPPSEGNANAPPEAPAQAEIEPASPPPRYKSLPTGPPPTGDHGVTVPTIRQFSEPVWNAWVEASSSKIGYRPVTALTNQEYSVVLNLAALAYGSSNRSVYSTETSNDLQTWLERQKNVDNLDVEVIVSLERRFFVPQSNGERAKSLTVDLARIRRAQRDGFTVTDDVFEDLRDQKEQAPFWFGAQTFKVRTTSVTGPTNVTFFVWANGRPVDEINMPICIRANPEDSCQESAAPKPVTLRGVDLSGKADYPDAALQFVERDSSVTGVFHCNTCTGGPNPYYPWEIYQTGDWFAQQVARILTQMTQTPDEAAKETPAQIFERSGNSLADLMFDPAGPGASEAREAFTRFLFSAAASTGKPRPPTLFVRLLPTIPSLVLTPLNVMHLTLPGGSKVFVGEVANVETPLEFQDYSTPESCISDWTLFVPPKGHLPVPDSLQDVSEARVAFDPWIHAFSGSCNDCVISTENDFQSWLEKVSGKPKSSAVLILSHHFNNALSFYSSGNPSVGPEAVQRFFTTPSVVIIDACGTAAPGASEFIRQFNAHGMSTVIATYTEVEPAMAGQFLTLLFDNLAAHPEYTMSDAKFLAARDLAHQYGPRALAFMLIGNGAVHACFKPRRAIGTVNAAN